MNALLSKCLYIYHCILFCQQPYKSKSYYFHFANGKKKIETEKRNAIFPTLRANGLSGICRRNLVSVILSPPQKSGVLIKGFRKMPSLLCSPEFVLGWILLDWLNASYTQLANLEIWKLFWVPPCPHALPLHTHILDFPIMLEGSQKDFSKCFAEAHILPICWNIISI